LAPALEMEDQEVYGLRSEPDPIAAIRETYDCTPLRALYVTTNTLGACKLLKGTFKRSEVWTKFLGLLKVYECPVLVFNLDGVGLSVLTRFPGETPQAGDVRIQIIAKNTAIDAYIIPFSAYLEYMKTL